MGIPSVFLPCIFVLHKSEKHGSYVSQNVERFTIISNICLIISICLLILDLSYFEKLWKFRRCNSIFLETRKFSMTFLKYLCIPLISKSWSWCDWHISCFFFNKLRSRVQLHCMYLSFWTFSLIINLPQLLWLDFTLHFTPLFCTLIV